MGCNMTIEVGILIGGVAAILAILGYSRTSSKSNRDEGCKEGEQTAILKNIQSKTDETWSEIRNLNATLNNHSEVIAVMNRDIKTVFTRIEANDKKIEMIENKTRFGG